MEAHKCTAVTKNGIIRLAAPPTHDISKYKSDKKITDEEILAILEQPLSKAVAPKKNKPKKKKKPAKKVETPAEEEDDDDDDDSDDE